MYMMEMLFWLLLVYRMQMHAIKPLC